jgi:hypothetical protein
MEDPTIAKTTEEYSKIVDIDLNTIKAVDKISAFNSEKYEGKKVLIGDIKIKEETDHYHGGKVYDATSTEKMFRVYIYTEPIKELDEKGNFTDKILQYDKDGVMTPVTVHVRFNLGKDAEGKPEISKHPKADLWKFMRKHGAATLPELKGKLVMLNTELSGVEGDNRKFLRIG